MVNWIEEYNKREEKIKSIVSSDEYVKWLKKFMLNKHKFINDDLSYYSNRINDEDRIKIDMLPEFFDGIDYYASDKDLYPSSCECGIYYNIKYNDFCFKIGVIVSQENNTFCERTLYNNQKNYIDFNDIIDNSKAKKRLKIR